jgi:hypothetical protein
MNAASVDVKDILESSEAGTGLTFLTDLFIGMEPDSPDAVVTLYDSGGWDPDANDYLKPTIMARIRGPKGGYTTGYATARAVVDALHERNQETWNGTRYIAIWLQGDVMFLEDPQNLLNGALTRAPLTKETDR